MTQLIAFYMISSGCLGCVFALYLLITGHRNRAIQLLSALLATASYTIAYQGFKILPTFYIPKILIGTDDPLPFLFGPLFYLFILAIATDKKISHKTLILHFIPFIVYATYFGIASLSSSGENFTRMHTVERALATLGKLISGMSYVALSLQVLKNYNERIKKVYSSLVKIDLSWFSGIIYIQISLWLVALLLYLVAGTGLKIEYLIDPVTYSLATVGIYSLFFFWWYERDIFLSSKVIVPEPVAQIVQVESDQKKYQKSGLSKDELERSAERLHQVMNRDKPFLDNDLTLKKLAESLAMSSHHLSQVINEKSGKNFYDYINEFRIEEVKRELQNPKKDNHTILAIALDCGFSSKSTFNICFKKYTGLTPSQYKSSGS